MQMCGLIALLAVLGCDLSGESKLYRGRVIDQDTGLGVEGAIVVASYMGGSSWSGSGCNRVESTVSNANGEFVFPRDDAAGVIVGEAYKRGYGRGKPNMNPFPANEGRGEWRVALVMWNETNDRETEVGVAPGVYYSREHAERELGLLRNVYVRAYPPDRERRLGQLRMYQIFCGGGPKTTAGLVPLLEAMLEEQIELQELPDKIVVVREVLDLAKAKGGPR